MIDSMETDAVPAGTQDGPHSQELAHASPSPMADGGKSDGYVPMMPDPADDAATWTSFPFVIKKFNPVFFWSWDVHSENCAICRVMLMEPCLNCQVNNKTSCVGKYSPHMVGTLPYSLLGLLL